MARKSPRWYFSFRSPYSWLAYRDLVGRYPDVAAAIEWRPFWEPDRKFTARLTGAGGQFPYVPMSKEKHRYILQDLRRLAAGRGLSFRWPVDIEPRWEVAHLGYLAAERAGHGRRYVDEVYRARWELGENISDPAVVAAAAERAGLDGAAVAAAEGDPDVIAAGVRALKDVDSDGVFGVPFFVRGFDKYWGVERLPGFAQAVRAGRDAARPADVDGPAPGLVAAADFSHAGGCG